jgi:hypothetical protein
MERCPDRPCRVEEMANGDCKKCGIGADGTENTIRCRTPHFVPNQGIYVCSRQNREAGSLDLSLSICRRQ